ncbi:MAG TPA: glycoside hydrolase family 36 protein [Propionibacteriaceae bacterium]|nr:glycoside hydrolase family 36 protein [Propionibacteriaceae bacterium]
MLLAAYAESMTAVAAADPSLLLRVSGNAAVRRDHAGGLEVIRATSRRDTESLMFSVEVPLADAAGFWHPNTRHYRTLPADWAGRETLSLVCSTPIGVLYDAAGAAVMGFACDETVDEVTMRFGVCEERKTFVVHLELAPKAGRSNRLAVSVSHAPWTDVLTVLREWLAEGLGIDPLPVPSSALEPVYSTWYTFTQQISAEVIEEEAAIARSIGCASVFIDDGWQQFGDGRGYAGCGDWRPDPDKFPDLRAHVGRLHQLGMAVVLWVAPLLVGELAQQFPQLASWASHFDEVLQTHILDPRLPEVRDHVVEICVRMMKDYGLDGLKIDFLDRAEVYSGTDSSGDVPDVGLAMLALLRRLREAVASAGFAAPLLEFRQPYVSPSLAPYGNVLRAADCPADAVVNRTSIIDCRLLSFGQVVHSDMLMWDPAADLETATRQLLNVFFAVPQISMRLAHLSSDARTALASTLARWRSVRDLALAGTLSVGSSDEHYPVVQSWDGAGNGLIGIYAASHVPLDLADVQQVTLLNGTRNNHLVLDVAEPADVQVTIVRPDGVQETYRSSLAGGLVKLPAPPCGIVVLDRLPAAPADSGASA